MIIPIIKTLQGKYIIILCKQHMWTYKMEESSSASSTAASTFARGAHDGLIRWIYIRGMKEIL